MPTSYEVLVLHPVMEFVTVRAIFATKREADAYAEGKRTDGHKVIVAPESNALDPHDAVWGRSLY